MSYFYSYHVPLCDVIKKKTKVLKLIIFPGSRLLSTLGFQQFLDADETSGEFVDEGKELIKREKRRRDRLRGREV